MIKIILLIFGGIVLFDILIVGFMVWRSYRTGKLKEYFNIEDNSLDE